MNGSNTVPVSYAALKKLKSKYITESSHYEGKAPAVEGRILTCKIASNMLLIITYSRMVFWLMLSVTWVQNTSFKISPEASHDALAASGTHLGTEEFYYQMDTFIHNLSLSQ